MPFIASKNAATINEASGHLRKALQALNGIDLRSLPGITREQAAEFRAQIKTVRSSLTEDIAMLDEAAAARKEWFPVKKSPGSTPAP